MFTNRVLDIGRRLVVALLAVALSSQLMQGQVLRCAQMDMRDPAMSESSMGSSHAGHKTAQLISTTSDRSGQQQAPASSTCVLSGVCVSAPAVPVLSYTEIGRVTVSPVIPFQPVAPSARAVRPEAPPPRL